MTSTITNFKKALINRWQFLAILIGLFTTLNSSAQNLGFEAVPQTYGTAVSGWTPVTLVWSYNATARTGASSMSVTDPATSGSTMGCTTGPLVTTSAGNFLITIGWGRSNTAANASFIPGYRTGSTNTLNPSATTTPGAQFVLNNTSWTRIVSASTATVSAGTYGPALRAFRQTSTTGTILYMDDFIIYASSSNVPDLTAPNAASAATLSGTVLNWSNGTDNGAPASGIGGVVIVRAPGTGLAAPTLNDQAMYNAVNGTAGTSSFVSGGNTWTVVADIAGSATTTFNDATGGPSNTYYVFMRDLAYNYSAGAAVSSGPCTDPPTAGAPSANPSTVCAGGNSNLGLTGGTGGIGQTYQWQSSTVNGGPYTNVGASSASPSLTVTSAVTTYYVCQVTCGSGTSQSAQITVNVTPAFPGGTYTINSTLATGGGNYQTFAAAINAMTNCGIAGPVIFNVDATSGPYAEQVIIPQIAGVSALNTITFNGNGRTITSASVDANNRHIIKLDGADYVTLNNLVLTSTGTYGWGVHFINGADNNTVNGCTINCNTTSTTLSDQHPIIFSGSTTVYNTAGVTGSNNTISNNTLNGGYYGVTMVGNALGTEGLNNNVTNNIIREFYSYGVYATFERSCTIGNNDFSRTTRATSTTASSVFLTTGCLNMLVEKNRVHNFFDAMTANTSTFYGMAASTCDATVGEPNRFINNLVYDIRHNGIIYGIYNTGSDYMTAYHNTISLDYVAATAGTAYGCYQTTSAIGLVYRNNNITIRRGGSGVKIGLNYSTAASTITSNNNNVYLNSAGSGTQNYGGYGGTNYATLALWQTNANGGIYDGASANVDPLYVSPATGDFTPTTLAMDNLGAPVGVLTDILGASRSGTTPDIGAYEFTISSADDIGALLLVTPATTGCYSNVQTVVIRVRNYGGPIDFSVSPATITCNITGTATATLTANLVGTLATNATVDVTLTGTFDMSTNGTYTFNAFTTCVSDGNATNNAMAPVSRTRSGAVAGTLASSATDYCVSGTPTLTLTGNANGTSQWQMSTVSSSGPWTNITGTTTYTPASALTQTTYYRVETTCLTTTVQSNVVTVTVNSPTLTGVTNANLCGIGAVTLGATPAGSSTVNWYAAPTGGSPLVTGANTFTTPVISSTTTYYAAASSGGLATNVGKVAIASSASGTGGGISTYVNFDALSNFTLETMDLFPYGATDGVAGTITLELRTAAGVSLMTKTVNVIAHNTTALSVPQTVTVGWPITGGASYRLGVSAWTGGVSNMFRDDATLTTVTYPYTAPGIVSITSPSTAGYYYFFYNWLVSTGCEGPRTAVTANVVPAPAITPSTPLSLVCSGGTTTLNVASSNAGYSYTWTPGNLTGASVSVSPATTTTYTVTALDNSGGSFNGCTVPATLVVTAQPSSASVVGTPESICAASGSSVLSLSPSSYPAGTVQWQSSPNGVAYTNVGGATNNTYNTGTISSSTYYKALIMDANSNVCLQPFKEIVVGIPTLNSTTPNTRCGTGTTTLQATGSAGATIKWYTASTGGFAIGSGSPFTTPIINNTTTYYASAETGGGSPASSVVGAGATTSATYSNPFYSAWSNTHNQHLILASELYAAGMSAGLITAGGLNITVAGTLPMIDLSIKMANTTATNMSAYLSPAFTTVYSSPSVMPIVGVNSITFTTPFIWDGVSNVVIEICHGNPSSTTTMSRTCTMEATSYVSSIHTQTSAATSAAVQCSNTTTNLLTFNTRPQFYFTYVPACSSSRIAVTATVTPAPAITAATTAAAICPGGTADISVSSVNDPNYSYVWTSNPAGYSSTGAGPLTVNPTVTTTYIVTATDNSGGASQGCAMIDSVKIINGGTLVAGTVSASQSTLCLSGSSLLTLTGASGGANQWQSSTVGTSGPWTNVGTGAITYNTGTITQTTYYHVVTSCNSSSVTSNAITITVNNPSVATTTPATRCGTGTVTLSATASSGATLKWYTASTGGTSVFTGASYTTPAIATTTNYYVSATNGGGGSINVASPTATTSTFFSAATGWGLRFSVNTACTINSVNVVASNATAGAATMQIKVTDLADVVLYTGTLHNFTIGTSLATYTIPVNISIAPGTNYKMVMTSTGINNLVRESGGVTFPYNSPGNEVSITAGANGVTTAQTTSAYYWFYNWVIATGCESARTLVAATVTPAPALNIVASDLGICNGGSTTLSVNSPNDPNYTYTWTSNPSGFNQTGSGPFTQSPAATTKYYVSAIDNSGGSNNGCVITDSVSIIVTGTLTAGTAVSSSSTYCISGTPTLTLTGYDGAIQWQRSTVSSTGPWTNVGTGLATYTPGAPVTQTSFYQAVVSCSGSSLTSNAVTVTVNNPQITGTTPNTRCGAGTVTLNATSSAGTSVNWYASATGGLPIGTGTSFTTPVIASTTNFYAAAASPGGGNANVGMIAPTGTSSGVGTSTYGLRFDALSNFTLNSLVVYPNAGSNGTPGTLTIGILDSVTSSIIQQVTVNVTGYVQSSGLTPVTVNLGLPIAASLGLRMVALSYTGISGLVYVGSPCSVCSYPYTIPGVASIKYGTYTNSFHPELYYYFYNWNVSTGCEGNRVAVPANVTASPVITASATFTTPCAGNPTDLSVSSGNAGYSYSWSSTPVGFNQTGTGPLTVTPAVPTTYQVLATDNSGGAFDGCGALATVVVTPTANPLTVNASATPSSICPGQSAQLNASATTATGIAAYTFTSTTSAYTPITGGTVLASAAWDDVGPGLNIPLGFTFNYNGVSYTTCNINLNGYISFGTTTTNNNFTPISTLVTNEVGIVAAFARDLEGLAATGEIRYLSSGGVFTIQWTDARRFHTLANAEVFSFQLKLYQNTNQIRFVYGNFSNAVSAENANLTQIGLRGTVTSDYKNLQILSGGNWSAPTLGTANTQTCYYNEGNTATKPTSGLTYIFSPPSGNLTYDWSTNPAYLSSISISNPVVQVPTSTETYTVIVTQTSTGCTKSATQTVTLKPAPDPSISNAGSVCAGFPITLGATNNAPGQSSGNTYSWSTDAVTPYSSTSSTASVTSNATVNNSGNYTVVITNSFLCTASATDVVTVNPNPVLNASSITDVINESCPGASDGSFQATATSGTAPFDYSIDGGNSSNQSGSFTGLTPGTYSVQVVSDFNGCVSASTPVTITSPNLPPTVSCPGNQAANAAAGLCSAVVSYSTPGTGIPAPDVTYAFTGATTGSGTGNGSGEAFNVGTTTVTVTVSNSCGTDACSFDVVVTDTQNPVITCPANIAICNPTSQVVNFTVNATDNCSIASVVSTPASGSIFPVGTTTVNSVATDVNGNTSTCSFTVTISTPSTAPTSATTDAANNNICLGNSVILTQVGGSIGTGASYKWYSGSCGGTLVGTGASITLSPAATTTYYVRAEGACNTTTCASVTVVVSTSPVTSLALMPFTGMPSNVCAGTVATLSIAPVSRATYYVWDAPTGSYFNGVVTNVSPFTTTTPSVQVTFGSPSGSLYNIGVQAGNACGTSVRQSQKVRGLTSVPASVSGPTTACANSVVTYSTAAVTGATSYLWTVTGNATVSGTGTTATVTFGSTYTGGTVCVAAQTTCYTSPTKCITISTSASTLNAISGTFTACPNSTLTYSVPASTGAASYTWTLPPGATGSSTTNSINVTYGAGYSAVGSICVSVTSTCGVTSAVKCKTVAPGLPSQPASISGALTGLCNQTVVYSTPSQGSGITYTWTSPGTINTGQGSTSISTTFAALSTGNVCVTASNSCGSSTSRCVPVKGAPNAPGAITATPPSWCANTSGIEFDVNTASLTGTYTLSWTYPPAAVVTYAFGGGNSNSLILDWKTGSGNVNVTASNGCGTATKTSTWSSTCREGSLATVSSISVSPNPTTGMLNINYTATKGITVINVLDLAGRVVMTQTTSSIDGANATQIDLGKVAKGAYMLSVQSTQGNKQVRVVVE